MILNDRHKTVFLLDNLFMIQKDDTIRRSREDKKICYESYDLLLVNQNFDIYRIYYIEKNLRDKDYRTIIEYMEEKERM